MTDVRAGGVQIDVAYVPPSPAMRIGGLQIDVAYVYGGPPAPTGPAVSVWNGTVEVSATMSVWNGTAEIPALPEVI